ncbi:hypothetical protein RN001_003709 [Aquatica leii]|uniref:YqaJ viral recombinase domain-containing protein n=1 Tax=Aquatica leii TaxID=1421715 RepID=A0AAN7PIZ2_9COLE|nr:hypothetical protein RN001_003709 [Aquatica leii]
MTEDELREACKLYLEKIVQRSNSLEKIKEIEHDTRGQHENPRWQELRKDCLTASNFGVVVKRRTSTSCHNLIKRLLYSQEIHENVAIQKYENQFNVKIEKCGLFIDSNNFLGASPDGLIGTNGLVEIKCLPSIGVNPIKDSATSTTCFEIKDGNVQLKKNHNYYFQVQGQLNITGREYCDFVIFTENDFHVEKMFVDRHFWQETMLPKLKLFFINCMLPEIVNARIPRGLKVRDPSYITEAKHKQKTNKHIKCFCFIYYLKIKI